ncbi:MAG TPA: hypothetical protein VF331_09330 [Polyangiales bacterium]
MQFWEELSPAVRKGVFVGIALLVGLLALRYYAATPVGNVTQQRGLANH